MSLTLSQSANVSAAPQLIVLVNAGTDWKSIANIVDANLAKAAQQAFKDKRSTFVLNSATEALYIVNIDSKKQAYETLESARKAGFGLNKQLNAAKVAEAALINATGNEDLCAAFVEGFALTNYEFLKYKVKDERKSLKKLTVATASLSKARLNEVNITVEAVGIAKTLINEPLSFLTAVQLGKEFKDIAAKGGFKAEVLDKKKIESLKMGGLLAVNRGSIDPPTFSVLEYKPAKSKNKQPIVLVGKGIVYDTGGLSLKPTPNSMDQMKCDMSGAACVGAVLYAVAKLKLPLHIIALVPATDNRPGENAYVPGDVITHMDGTTSEVLNTDAEGRLVLADALHYAKRYKPELVFDFATLTGAAMRTFGTQCSAMMGTASPETKAKLTNSAYNTFERIWELPLWDDYGTMLKSDVADMKNIGGELAGAITAGKYLEHFTDYPWIHLDIAGTAFTLGESDYRGKQGIGVGVRMMVDFLKNY
jgi:leucyl aminopeptidase